MNKLHKELNEAILAFTMGDELKAEEALLGITAKFPDSLEAWRALAEVYLAQGTLGKPVARHCHWMLMISRQ